MKIRLGFVSNSSSTSFVLIIKNNLDKSVTFKEFLDTISPQLNKCFKRLHFENHITTLPYSSISDTRIKPGLNKIVMQAGDDGSLPYYGDEKILNMLSVCHHDPLNRFEWNIVQAGQQTDIDEEYVNLYTGRPRSEIPPL